MRVLERKAFSTCPYHHVLSDHDFGGGSRATANLVPYDCMRRRPLSLLAANS